MTQLPDCALAVQEGDGCVVNGEVGEQASRGGESVAGCTLLEDGHWGREEGEGGGGERREREEGGGRRGREEEGERGGRGRRGEGGGGGRRGREEGEGGGAGVHNTIDDVHI